MQQWQNSIRFFMKNKKLQQPEHGQAILVLWASKLMWNLIRNGWKLTHHFRFTHSENRWTVYLFKEDKE